MRSKTYVVSWPGVIFTSALLVLSGALVLRAEVDQVRSEMPPVPYINSGSLP